MTTYVLCQGVTAVQAAPTSTTVPSGSQAVNPSAGVSPINPQSQTFQLSVSGTGAVSASAQIMVSSDGKNWVNYGTPLTASGTGTGQSADVAAEPWSYYTAYITAISGTGATAAVQMNV